MQHWQLGRRGEARDYHDRAMSLMDKHNPENPRLIRLHEEASALIGTNP